MTVDTAYHDPANQASMCNHEWRRLSSIGQQVAPGLFGKITNFVVTPMGHAGRGEGVRFVRARCSAPGRCPDDPEAVVLLKVKESDWTIMQWAERPVKILQAVLLDEPLWRFPLIDCCGAETVLVSQVNTSTHEVLTVAELFTGGFMGWTQGAVVLHQFNAPISVRWGLEVAADCIPMQQTMVPGLQVVSNEADIQSLDASGGSMAMVVADVNRSWWLKMFQRRPVNTWTVSAPCQPWSVAGREGGLCHEMGRIMLRLVDLAAIYQPQLVLFEQVAGFASHRDYEYILNAWKEVGYVVTWRATLELADIMPCNRNRHLLVMSLKPSGSTIVPLTRTWGCKRTTDLNHVQAVLDLPWDYMSMHIPPAPVLQKYLDPAYMPKVQGAVPDDLFSYRVRAGSHTAGCFLAQYGHAHLLPHDLLASKGLFGSLVLQGHITRFFSSSEVASLHCTILPTLSNRNRRLAMRLVGNSIAVPHAAIAMLKGCHEMGLLLHVSPKQVVVKIMDMRLHNGNASLLPRGADWVMCRNDEVLTVLKDTVCCQALQSPPALETLLQPLVIATPHGHVQVWLSPALHWQQALQALGYPATMLLQAQPRQEQLNKVVPLPHAPLLPGTEDERAYVKSLGFIVVCTRYRVVILPTASVSHVFCLSTLATETLSMDDAPRYAARFSGCRLPDLQHLPPLVLLLPEDKDPDVFALDAFSCFGSSCEVQLEAGSVLIKVPARHAFDIWRGWPLDHLACLGWGVDFQPPLPDGTVDLTVHLWPLASRVAITPEGLLKTLAPAGLQSRLQCIQSSVTTNLACPVEVQVVAHTIWTGTLPLTFRAELMLQWWGDLARTLHLEPTVRLFSGPHPLPQSICPGDLASGHVAPCVRRRSGHVLFSLHPCYAAGGNKEETKQWAMTSLATLALSQKTELAAVTTFVGTMIEAIGAPKLAALLNEPNDHRKWEAVTEAAKARDVALPEVSHGRARAEARSKKAAQRQKAQRRRMRAADLRPTPGFFVNADGTPATFLDNLSQGPVASTWSTLNKPLS